MRQTATLVLCLISCTTLFLSGGEKDSPIPLGAPPPHLPNVLLITIDTLRADRLSCYDPSHVQTPNIDRLAERGVLFERAFAHTPLTLPSHVSILLGTTPIHHGVHDNVNYSVHPDHLTLAEHLKTLGYHTAAFVSATPLDSRFGLDQGFDIYDDNFMPPGTPKIVDAEQKADVAVQKAMDWYQKKKREPWFLWIHLYDPHLTYDPPEPFRSRYDDRLYDGEVAFVDSALGRLFDNMDLDSDKTVVVLTSDHGEGLGDHGESTHGTFVYNSTIRVPLIIVAPKIKTLKTEELATHSDIWPTLCDLIGIDIPPGLQGNSLLPALKQKPLASRHVYFESLYWIKRGWAPVRGYLDGKKKYIESPLPELYDLAMDFGEKTNLAKTIEIDRYKLRFDRFFRQLSPATTFDAQSRLSSDLRKKLESLGYLSGSDSVLKDNYGPEDDVKVLGLLFNRIGAANNLKNQGKRAEAILRLENLIKEERTLDIAYKNLSDLYLEDRNHDKVIALLKEGYDRFPWSSMILGDLVELLLMTGELEDVIRLTETNEYTAEMNQDPTIWYNRGEALVVLNDIESAVDAFQRAVDADGEYIDALYNLGNALLVLGTNTKNKDKYKQAIPILKKLLTLDAHHAKAHYGLGSAYLSLGEVDLAIPSLERALKSDPELAMSLYTLGAAYYMKQDFRRAGDYFLKYKDKTYIQLSPEQRKNLDLFIQTCRAINR